MPNTLHHISLNVEMDSIIDTNASSLWKVQGSPRDLFFRPRTTATPPPDKVGGIVRPHKFTRKSFFTFHSPNQLRKAEAKPNTALSATPPLQRAEVATLCTQCCICLARHGLRFEFVPSELVAGQSFGDSWEE